MNSNTTTDLVHKYVDTFVFNVEPSAENILAAHEMIFKNVDCEKLTAWALSGELSMIHFILQLINYENEVSSAYCDKYLCLAQHCNGKMIVVVSRNEIPSPIQLNFGFETYSPIVSFDLKRDTARELLTKISSIDLNTIEHHIAAYGELDIFQA